MRFSCFILLLGLAGLEGTIEPVFAGDQSLAGTLWLTEPGEWTYRPPAPEWDPIRSSFSALLFFHSDGTLTRLDAALIEGLHPKRPYVSISNGDGFLLYAGTWKVTGEDTYAVQYQLLVSDKALGPVRERRVKAEVRSGAKGISFRGSTFVHPEVLFGRHGSSLPATYLQYVCPILSYHEKHVAECKATE